MLFSLPRRDAARDSLPGSYRRVVTRGFDQQLSGDPSRADAPYSAKRFRGDVAPFRR